MTETKEDLRRQAAAAKLARVPALAAAADKFYGFVAAHTNGDPDVSVLTAEVLLDFAAKRHADRAKIKLD